MYDKVKFIARVSAFTLWLTALTLFITWCSIVLSPDCNGGFPPTRSNDFRESEFITTDHFIDLVVTSDRLSPRNDYRSYCSEPRLTYGLYYNLTGFYDEIEYTALVLKSDDIEILYSYTSSDFEYGKVETGMEKDGMVVFDYGGTMYIDELGIATAIVVFFAATISIISSEIILRNLVR